MAEIIAAAITVGASGCFSALAYIYKKKHKRGINKDKYLKHHIFDLKHITPITVDYDKVREELFRYIQFEIIIETVQDVLKDWIINLDSDNFNGMNSGELDNYTIGQEISLIIGNIRTAQNKHIDILPRVLQNTILQLLVSFYAELDNVLSLVNFEHGCGRNWLTLILDVLYLVILNTVNFWRITSNKINGTLNGVKWKDTEMAYSWFNDLTKFCNKFENVWNFYIKNNIFNHNKFTYTMTDDKGLVVNIDKHTFHHMTEYTLEDMMGHNCKILQMNLSKDDKTKNITQNAYIHECMYNRKYFHATLIQATNITKTVFLFDVYSLPLALITDTDTKYIHVALQAYHKNPKIREQHVLNMHTTASSLLACCLKDSVLTICKYTEYTSLIVVDVFNNNTTGLMYKRGVCLSTQIRYSMRSIDYALKSGGITIKSDIEVDLINSVSFQYDYENTVIRAECWILNDVDIVVSHSKIG